jgi:hypothetical protein
VSVASVIQHAKRMRRIILSSVVCLAVQYFTTLSHKRHDCQEKKKVTEHKKYVLIFSSSFVWNISHSKKNSATYYHECALCLQVNYLLLLSGFNEIWIFWGAGSAKILKYQITWKIRPVGTEMFHANGQTDGHDEANNPPARESLNLLAPELFP